jgi:hypothetical protein
MNFRRAKTTEAMKLTVEWKSILKSYSWKMRDSQSE